MSGFFEEVKRRKVYRVAVAYVIAAGGIIQLASAAFPAWELPSWSLRLVIVLLLIGFPIALILAWAFDVTSQGIKTTPAVVTAGSHRRRNVIMLVATGIMISAAAGFFLLPAAAGRDYDRDLTDVFAIQTDLAQKIANELQAKLSPSEKAQIESKPTQNAEAYLAFVRAHDLQSSSYEDLGKLKQGEEAYERAITLDPNFALAFARYSQLESWIVHSFERASPRREKARSLAVRAVQLQPQLPEAHLALGFVYDYVDNNFQAAASEFEIAEKGLPNESEGYLALGAIQRRQGKWTESNASLEKAVSLNPNDTWSMQNLAINYEMQRKWDAASQILERALAITPTAFGLMEIKCKVAIEERS